MARQPFDCLSCPKFHPHDLNNLKKGGSCRAVPPLPSVMMVGVERNPITGHSQPIIHAQTTYPGVGVGDYCHLHPLAQADAKLQGGENNTEAS
jgi:hypothetical protein